MNENWRIMLALVLTLLVLVGWNFLFVPQEQGQLTNKTRPEKTQQQVGEKVRKVQEKEDLRESKEEKIPPSDYQTAQGKKFIVETPLYKAVLNSNGGILEKFLLKKYDKSIKKNSKHIDLITSDVLAKAPLGILLNNQLTWNQVEWNVHGKKKSILHGSQAETITFRGEVNGVILLRRLKFKADSYEIEEKLQIQNKTDKSISDTLALTLVSKKLVANETRFNKTNISYYSQNKLQNEDDTDDLGLGIQSEEQVKWGGIDSNYFLLAAAPTNDSMFLKGKYEQGLYRIALESNVFLNPGQSKTINTTYYLGPKLQSYLNNAPNNLLAAINYGWLDFIAKPLVRVLNFFYKYVGNYGLAIIVLTFFIKIIFWPLSHKSYKSMEQMKKIQPMMKKLKEQYKDDRQKMNQELMRLYKTYKVNPAGGCMPMLLQIPVFIGLYEALLGAVELRHASFIDHVPFTDITWLADLSAKDPLYVTPVLMGLSMFLQQKMSPTVGDPTQAKIMLIMPVFLTFIFLNFPAGLVVYFITNNILSIAQQAWILRKA